MKNICVLLFLVFWFFIGKNVFAAPMESIFDRRTSVFQDAYPYGWNPIRVHLSIPVQEQYILESEQPFRVAIGKYILPPISRVIVSPSGESIRLTYGKYTLPLSIPIQMLPVLPGQVFQISNIKRIPAWDTTETVNDNTFLGGFDIRIDEGRLTFVNELDLEEYLSGMAEVLESEPDSKRKALSVLIRSYALYYMQVGTKFPGKHYHASDDPKSFQKYLGYHYSLRSPKWQAALRDTKGEILTHHGQVFRAAYFSCTLDGKTKLPSEAGW